MMKRWLTILLVYAGVMISRYGQASLVYEDNFDNDSLGVNANGVGGGMSSRTIRGGNHYWDDTGVLQFVTTGNTHFLNRVIAYTDNSFKSSDGFELTVDYFWTSDGGASSLSFGLVSDDTDLSAYSGLHPFSGDTAVYSFGMNADNGNLAFSDGTAVTNLDNAAGSLGPAASTSFEVTMNIVPNGSGGANWAWSINSVTQGVGNVASFDFSKNFHFVAYGQDDQGNKGINSVSLTAIPEPATLGLISAFGCSVLFVRRLFMS
ncbi:hypothetical protein [Pontiella sp.]|uniref:hypothetical protein n=1 Tax=Pontiella sp. TaxID=2837462 RepID=UPI0035612ABB